MLTPNKKRISKNDILFFMISLKNLLMKKTPTQDYRHLSNR